MIEDPSRLHAEFKTEFMLDEVEDIDVEWKGVAAWAGGKTGGTAEKDAMTEAMAGLGSNLDHVMGGCG